MVQGEEVPYCGFRTPLTDSALVQASLDFTRCLAVIGTGVMGMCIPNSWRSGHNQEDVWNEDRDRILEILIIQNMEADRK
jgi:hypothetical protein